MQQRGELCLCRKVLAAEDSKKGVLQRDPAPLTTSFNASVETLSQGDEGRVTLTQTQGVRHGVWGDDPAPPYKQ